MIRILIVDDHSIVRQGLKQIVSECPGMVVAGEAASGQEMLDLVRSKDFDVAILDLPDSPKAIYVPNIGDESIRDLCRFPGIPALRHPPRGAACPCRGGAARAA
jgi:DNA-binding NarL/FixJ family response regulator